MDIQIERLTDFKALNLKMLHKTNVEELLYQLSDYNHAAAIHSGISNTDKIQSVNRLKAAADNRVAAVANAILAEFKHDQNIILQHNKRLELQKEWLKEDFWRKHQLKQLSSLKKMINKFSYYNNKSIAKSIETLEKIESWFKQAQLELLSYSAQNPEVQAVKSYHAYLINARSKIAKERTALVSAVFNRLILAANKVENCHADIIYHTATVINKIKPIVQYNYPAQNDFNGSTLKSYLDYIIKYGTPKQKQILARKHWRLADDSSYAKYIRFNKVQILPLSLANYIPSDRGGLLQFDKRYRYKLSEKIIPLINECYTLQNKNLPGIDILTDKGTSPAINSLFSTYEALSNTIKEFELNKTKGLLSIFYIKSNLAINLFQKYLKQQQENILKKQIAILEYIAKNLQDQQNSALLTEQIKLTPEKMTNLDAILKKIEPLILKAENAELKSKYAFYAKKIMNVKSIESICYGYMSSIYANNPPRGGKLNVLYRYHKFINEGASIKPTWYEENRAAAVSKTLRRIKQKLEEHLKSTDIQQLSLITESVFRDATIIRQLSNQQEYERFKLYLYQYTKEVMLNVQNDVNAIDKYEFQINLIIILSNNEQLADSWLSKILNKIQKLPKGNEASSVTEMAQSIMSILDSKINSLQSKNNIAENLESKHIKSDENKSITDRTVNSL